eukprot:g2147.t1
MKLIDEILANEKWTIEVVHLINDEGEDIGFSYYTQNEICEKAKRLAKRLHGTGVHIGILIPRSVEFVVCVLAVILSKNVFIPLSSTWPKHHINAVLINAEITLLLTDNATLETIDKNSNLEDVFGMIPNHLVLEEALQDCSASVSLSNKSVDYCYVLYSSGSTGSPKGVCGTEEGILNRCHWMSQMYNFSSTDKIAFSTTPIFVDSIWQIFGPLLYGITQLILPKDVLSGPSVLWKVISESTVSVPSILRSLFAYLDLNKDSNSGPRYVQSLKMLISSGEPLDFNLAKLIRNHISSTCIFLNLYGCTEASGDSLAFEVPSNLSPFQDALMPIGFPIDKSCVLLLYQGGNLDEAEFSPVSAGSTGELCLAGRGLSKGYYNYQTKEQYFFQMPSKEVQSWIFDGSGLVSTDWQWTEEGIEFFRTGDLASISIHGIKFVSRKDSYIKINGIRVNLLQIEHTLRSHKAVLNAAVNFWPLRDDLSFPGGLAAYVILEQSFKNPVLSLRQYVAEELPTESWPRWIIPVTHFPHTHSGKLLRSRLPHPGDVKQQWTIFREQDVLSVFCEVLGIQSMEPTEDFFASGGDSRALLQTAEALEIDPMLIQVYPTARQLTAYLNGHISKKDTPFVVSTDPAEYKFINQSNGGTPCYQIVCQVKQKQKAYSDGGKESEIVKTSNKKRVREDETDLVKLKTLQELLTKWKSSCEPGTVCWIRNPCQDNRIFTPSGELVSHKEAPRTRENQFSQRRIHKIHELWSQTLLECVDGPLTTISFFSSLVGDFDSCLVLATCHGGKISCFDIVDGLQVWSNTIEGRAEFGAMVSTKLRVAIPSSRSMIFVLELENGNILNKIQLEGTIRAPVVMDPWKGALWAVLSNPNKLIYFSDANEILKYVFIVFLDSECSFSCESDGPIASAISFDCSSHQVFYTTLTGKLVALKYNVSPTLGVSYVQDWSYCTNEPIFGSPCCSNGVCLVSTVGGQVHCIDLQGQLKWRVELGIQVYSKIIILETNSGPWVLISAQEGLLFVLEISQGNTLLSLELSMGPITRPPVLTSSTSSLDDSTFISLAIMTTTGVLLMVSIESEQPVGFNCELIGFHLLNAEVFSPLLIQNDYLLIGSRDDAVHCIKVNWS